MGSARGVYSVAVQEIGGHMPPKCGARKYCAPGYCIIVPRADHRGRTSGIAWTY
jgi:hypothetical protein